MSRSIGGAARRVSRLVRPRPAELAAPPRPGARWAWELDDGFHDVYDAGLERSSTPPNDDRRARFYNTVQLFEHVLDLDGTVLECGSWKGLSSFLFCHALRRQDPSFDGEGFAIVDSFEGLSEPAAHDTLTEPSLQQGRTFAAVAGDLAGSLDVVKATLSEFPRVAFHRGWIPEVLDELPDDRYRFVHVDVDLYEPTLAAVANFYPRLRPGGMIVCDDYGSLLFPGAKTAVDEFCAAEGLRVFLLTTGQGALVKPYAPTG